MKSEPQFSVEGCHYEIAREGRHQEVVNFIRDHFIPDEPIAKCIADILPRNPEIWMPFVSLLKHRLNDTAFSYINHIYHMHVYKCALRPYISLGIISTGQPTC